MFPSLAVAATATASDLRPVGGDAVAARWAPSASRASAPTRAVLAASRPLAPSRAVRAGARALAPTRIVLAASPSGTYDAEGRPAGEPSAGAEAGEATQDLTTALDALREEVSGLAASVPERAAPAQVDAWLASFRRLEGAVAGLRSRLIGCVQASRAHEVGGHAAPTTYLKEALGVSGREAARQDKLARDLRGLPQTQAALSAGEIGPEQAQAIGRSARGGVLGDPGTTEAQLLPLARDRGAEDLSDEIRRLEQHADRTSLESAERRAHRRRRGTLVRRQDGMWDLQALLPDEHGEALATALDAFRTFDPPGTPIPEQRSPQQRTADAITDLVSAVLRGGHAPSSGGVLPQLNIVVPVEALDPDGSAVGELAHGGVLSAGALDRLLCDANLRRLLTRGDSEVLDAGRTRQQWTVAQRQALRVRDGGCRGPGCDRPVAWTHAHHLQPWSKDGPTSVDNGLLLCSFHHHQVHEGGWSVTLDTTTAKAVFRSPAGREVTTWPHRRGTRRTPPIDGADASSGSSGSPLVPGDAAEPAGTTKPNGATLPGADNATSPTGVTLPDADNATSPTGVTLPDADNAQGPTQPGPTAATAVPLELGLDPSDRRTDIDLEPGSEVSPTTVQHDSSRAPP